MFLSVRLVRNLLFDSLTWIGAHSHLYRHDEQQMEKFKACEKEMKTKAFSKEGLIQAAKLDPKEQEKEEAMQWVNHKVEELQMQVESTEAEVEALQGTGKKRNKGGSSNAGRLEQLEHLNDRRKWHIGRLEIVLRMLNNGSLPLEKMVELKEDVGYFVDGNTVRIELMLQGIKFDSTHDYRKRILTKMKVYTTNSTSMRKKRSLVLLQMTVIPKIQMWPAKVRARQFPERTLLTIFLDPPSRPTKKHDEESVTSSKRDDSPILKKASVSLQLRSQWAFVFISCCCC